MTMRRHSGAALSTLAYQVYGYTGIVGYSRVEGFWNFKNGHSASCAKLF